MNNTIYIINFGTNEHFNSSVGDKYYCKSPRSTAKKIKELLEKEKESNSKILKKDINKISMIALFNLSQFPARSVNIICANETDKRIQDLYINISTENLF